MIVLSAKSTRFAFVAIIALLLYAIAINVENSSGSQRYVVEGKGVDGSLNSYICLNMYDGVTKEMTLQKSLRMSSVTRHKMNIVSKWYRCGVL